MADNKGGGKVLDALDHPIVFVFFITLAVLGMSSLLTWGFKAAGLPGPAALSQHP
jgi:hypothetical protein